MNHFPVMPEDCLILRALHRSTSLREAARTLQCDPAGLMRKVQRISMETGCLQKIGGKWQLTKSGVLLVGWIEESILSQKRLLEQQDNLRICTTLWMAEQFVIPNLSKLQKNLQNSGVQVTGTEQNFETELIGGKADFVIVCHPPNDPAIAHKNIASEQWVIVVPKAWKKIQGLGDLKGKPFVRHKDLNPDLLLPDGILLEKQILMDSFIGIRSAVANGLGWSYVPKIAVAESLAAGAMVQLADAFGMGRTLSVWWLRHAKRSKAQSAVICAWAKETADLF